MGDLKKRLLWLTIWGIAFGMIEAAVVIYLREIFYPDGFRLPYLPLGDGLVRVELIREIATLLIMWSLAELVYKSFAGKFAVFIFLFGVWDVFYYVFLKIFLGWPESLATWDILFLLPFVWAGPVWAPILVSCVFIPSAVYVIYLHEQGLVLKPPSLFWIMEAVAAAQIITSFAVPGHTISQGYSPGSYPWILLLSGLVLGLGVFLQFINRETKRRE